VKKNRRGIIKNICYLLILALFLTGGVFSLSNCESADPVVENQPPQVQNEEPADPSLSSPEEALYEPMTDAPPFPPSNDSFVGIAQSSDKENATDLTFEDIRELVREAVRLAGGLEDIVKDGDTVVLKPNLVNNHDFCLPGWRGRPLVPDANGVTTDWRVTRAVAQLVRELNPSGKIYVMEGSAGNTAVVMQTLNYTKEHIPEVDEFFALETDSGAWQDFNSPGLILIDAPNGLLHSQYYFNRKFYEADVVINLPTLKNHWDAVVTGAVKNISIGATPANIYGARDGDTYRGHMVDHSTPNFHRWMADYYTLRPGDFTVMDALQGVENGPTPCFDLAGVSQLEQAQKNMRAMLAARDGLAIDIVMTNIMNWDIDSVQYLQYLIEAGVLRGGDTKNITVLGLKADDLRTDFAGVIPSTGGRRLTQAQKNNPPTVAIESASFEGQNLILRLNISDNTDKLDIYIDGFYAGSVSANMTDVTINAMHFAKGLREITVYAYEKYMHHAAASIRAEKESERIVLGRYDYAAPFAAVAPVIDGYGSDPAWALAEWRPIDQEWIGYIPSPEVFSGRYKIVWTEDRLYYLVEIVDNYISTTRADRPLFEVWNDDCLELFINEDGLGGWHERSHNAFAYHLSFGGENVVDLNTRGEPFLVNDHLNYVVRRTPGTDLYTWEVEMKVFDKTYDEDNHGANIPVKLYAGKEMGFAVAYCDADETNSRERFIGSTYIPGENKNVAWQNADVFARLHLVK
jgi:uncharacterized protein (DUF362 family)